MLEKENMETKRSKRDQIRIVINIRNSLIDNNNLYNYEIIIHNNF